MIKLKCLFVLFLFAIAPIKYVFSAEVIEPLQIFFTGNHCGKLVEIDKKLKLSPTLAWRTPSAINSLLPTLSSNNIIFDCGNISSVYDPISFLFEGKIELDFADKCSPLARSLSPEDLAVLDAKRPDRRMLERIFTNTEGKGVPNPFCTKTTHFCKGFKIHFFNFISPSRCNQLLINNWANITINPFVRAFRMLDIDTSEKDITISTVYGNKIEVEELANLFLRKKGTHFFIQMPKHGEKADYPYTAPIKNENTFIFSLEDGTQKLPMLKLSFKNDGMLRASLRMLPLNKCEKGNADELYAEAEKQIRNVIFNPLRIISVKEKASTSTNYLSKKSHAAMIKNAVRCDVALVLEPSQGHFHDNVINIGNIITTLENDRVYKLRLNGKEFKKTISSLFDEYGSQEIVFAGCSFKFFAGEIKDLKVGNIPINDRSVYTVAVPENTIKKSETLSDIYNRLSPEFDGLFMWNLWKNWLKTSKMQNNELFD